MASVTGAAWELYTAHLEAQRQAAFDSAFKWAMNHLGEEQFTRKCRRMMVENSIYHGKATAALAASWFDQVAKASKANVDKAFVVNDPVKLRNQRMAIALRKSLPKLVAGDDEGFCKAIASAVAADVKRQATNTMVVNAIRARAEFAWIPDGAETCAFCIMLASNGWQPAAKATAMGNHAEHIHDNCMCEFAIRFDDDTNYSGYDPTPYKEMYADADGGSWKAKVNSMRRDLYQENKETIKAQHRERYAALHQNDD